MQRTPLLTPDEAATYLHVSRLTLAQWRAERTGPRYIKLGTLRPGSVKDTRAVRYRQSDLDAYTEQNTYDNRHALVESLPPQFTREQLAAATNTTTTLWALKEDRHAGPKCTHTVNGQTWYARDDFAAWLYRQPATPDGR